MDIRLPDDADLRQPVILAFEANPSDDADLAYSIWIVHDWLEQENADPPLGWEGGHDGDHERFVIRRGHFDDGVARGMWEVFSGSILRHQGPPYQVPEQPGDAEYPQRNNGTYFQRVWFIPGAGDGSVTIRNVVLWYRRKVAEAD
jgi:hypothetical protein